MLIVVYFEMEPVDQLARIDVTRHDGVTELTPKHYQFKGVHSEVPFGFVGSVALNAGLFENWVD